MQLFQKVKFYILRILKEGNQPSYYLILMKIKNSISFKSNLY
jgi:hypothetical protein